MMERVVLVLLLCVCSSSQIVESGRYGGCTRRGLPIMCPSEFWAWLTGNGWWQIWVVVIVLSFVLGFWMCCSLMTGCQKDCTKDLEGETDAEKYGDIVKNTGYCFLCTTGHWLPFVCGVCLLSCCEKNQEDQLAEVEENISAREKGGGSLPYHIKPHLPQNNLLPYPVNPHHLSGSLGQGNLPFHGNPPQGVFILNQPAS